MLPEDAEALPENVPLTMDYAPVNELLEQKISQSQGNGFSRRSPGKGMPPWKNTAA